MKNGKYEEFTGFFWYLNDELHREDGPALEWPNGSKGWFLHGMLHREDGPAIEEPNGSRGWYLYGQQLTEEEFDQWLEKKALNERLHSTLPPKPTTKRGKI
jgi:hypothetical protein